MSVYANLAGAIVAACNAEGHDLDSQTFERFTDQCSVEERFAVWRELPTWAQRRIDRTAKLAERGMTVLPGGRS